MSDFAVSFPAIDFGNLDHYVEHTIELDRVPQNPEQPDKWLLVRIDGEEFVMPLYRAKPNDETPATG